ncbi:unnamed protein product [Orchesella dallaii]|uniref:Endonuclease/exonuclease/phosphatase domain-containing protein n=1 Tax=Orchesella dallaii TaxID=48710 RepID=A0ABP1RQK8_9HEXA
MNLDRLPPRESGEVETYLLDMKITALQHRFELVINTQEATVKAVEKLEKIEMKIDTSGSIRYSKSPMSYASAVHAREGTEIITDDGSSTLPVRKTVGRKVKKSQPAIIGKSKESNDIKYVDLRLKRAHVFISRLPCAVKDERITSWTQSKGINCLKVDRLPPKFEGQTYASFHLTLDKGEFEYSDFMDAELWPEDKKDDQSNYFGVIPSVCSSSDSSKLIFLGDFNCDMQKHSTFKELDDVLNDWGLVIRDYQLLDSTTTTLTSDSGKSKSWIDHVICSENVSANIHSMDVIESTPSDHAMIIFKLNINKNLALIKNSNSDLTCHLNSNLSQGILWSNINETIHRQYASQSGII